MAADEEDFPLINDPTPPHHPAAAGHPDAESVNGGDYFPASGSVPDPTTPSSKRHHGHPHYYYNVVKRQKPASTRGEANPNQVAEYRPSGGGSGGDYRKDREEWSDSAISCLLGAYTEKYNQLNRGNLRGRDWEEVAEAVSERGASGCNRKSVEQCKNKIDNLKKRYKVELQRVSGSGGSSWHWFKHIETIMGNPAGKGGNGGEVGVGAVGGGGDGDVAWGNGCGSGGVTSSGNVVVARQSKRYILHFSE